MASLLDLAARMDRLQKEIDEGLNNLTKNVALAIVDELADVTPLDTSAAASNWIVSLGRGVDDEVLPHVWKSESSRGITKNKAFSALKNRKAGQPIYITNNLDYIELLNSANTPSTKAPPGFIETAIAVGVAKALRRGIL